ncbi:MAG TPA: FMN-binding protein [Rhizomicrobium sp.]|jgi:uncharacterized protein with FMN-binding domain|nr:FMN-binding protein [Rhizomicrobium sp.]
MLKVEEKHANLTGKLLLSSALVAATLAYGWWQRQNTPNPHMAMVVPAPHATAPSPQAAVAAPPPAAASAASAAPATAPDTKVAAVQLEASKPAAPVTPKPTAAAPPQAGASASVAPQAPPQQDAAISISPPAQPLPTVPSNDVSPPLPAASGAPAAGIVPAIPAGTHLQDGDYVSDRHQLEWGDLRVKISVHGGLIAGVQILQYPDHRSRSLDLSEMAGPTLESEVIRTQHAQVDAVSSATDTSYAFQDTMADVILKATRE